MLSIIDFIQPDALPIVKDDLTMRKDKKPYNQSRINPLMTDPFNKKFLKRSKSDDHLTVNID